MCRQRLLLRRHRQMTQLSDDTRCTRRTSSTRHMMRLSLLQHAGERACEYREYRVCDVCVWRVGASDSEERALSRAAPEHLTVHLRNT